MAATLCQRDLVFQRNGIAFELNGDGLAQRITPKPVAQTLGYAMFCTGDDELDYLLQYARLHFLSPKLDDRRDATEKLWDAFERLKTLEPGADEKIQAEALLDRAAAPGSKMRAALGDEAKALTAIGNTLRIRHSEVTQELIARSEQLDWLFVRMFSFVRLLLDSSGRGA